MKLISIGNSFSVDGQRYLHEIAAASGKDAACYNLQIGGCSLDHHWRNVQENTPEYTFMHNAQVEKTGISVTEGLSEGGWDLFTLQQVSGFSGKPQSFLPALPHLMDFYRGYAPNARFYLQEVWAYEVGSVHKHFSLYHNDQHEMFDRICDAYRMAAALTGASLIPTGEVIQLLRDETDIFNPLTGQSLNRDGFHLSYDYGRFAAALTWYAVLFADPDEDVRQNTAVPVFDRPEGFTAPDREEEKLALIRNSVYEVTHRSENISYF